MNKLKSTNKPFDISKMEVWNAWLKVKGNQGAPGIDGQSLMDFEENLQNNLYKIWNRMSSGSYFPCPVKAVEIPKAHGAGIRVLGVPTIIDRIAQTVAASHLEAKVEPIFHPDSYGYRPKCSALDAVVHCTTLAQAEEVLVTLQERMAEVGLQLHPDSMLLRDSV